MGGGHAWVTLATNDSYSLGALVLAHSLKQVGTQQQLAVLITPGVTNSMRVKLSEVFNVVKEVNILDSKDEANLKLLKRPELGITFTKLHCWRLTQFEKCVFLDADTLVLENCDELFEREELSAAPDIGWPDCFNSGVFVYRPSNDTYEKLIQFALEKGSFDGGDQGLLNLYFSDWAHKDISKHLPFIYNMSSTACYSYLPAFKQFGKNAKIIHFLGSSKPWLQYFNTETRKVHPSEGLNHLEAILQLWWNIFCDLIHPKLSSDMTSHTDTVHGSQSYTSQNVSQTSHHHHEHVHIPSPTPNPAEDYQNVWDPWEEHDKKFLENSSQTSNPHQEHFDHHPQSSEIYTDHRIDSQTYQIQETPSDSNTHIEHHHPQVEHSQPHIEHNHPHPSLVEHHHPHTEQYHPHPSLVEHHHPHTEQYHSPVEYTHSHIEHYHTHDHSTQNRNQDVTADIDIGNRESHHQQNVIESHNTNAFSKAEHHVHIHHPTQSHPPPLHNPPSHYEPPPNCFQDKSSNRPPPPLDPRLPDECVATTTVSNEITLQTHSKEDSTENQAGLAGAFASLTLGQARTPEQEALDDHLRRQGWEVGNIDYLGRDSFENIWSKICETLSEGTKKESTPPKTEDKSAELVTPAVEATPEKVETAAPAEQVKTDPAPPTEIPEKIEAVVESAAPKQDVIKAAEVILQPEIPSGIVTETTALPVISDTKAPETPIDECPKPTVPVEIPVSSPETTETPASPPETQQTPVSSSDEPPKPIETAPAKDLQSVEPKQCLSGPVETPVATEVSTGTEKTQPEQAKSADVQQEAKPPPPVSQEVPKTSPVVEQSKDVPQPPCVESTKDVCETSPAETCTEIPQTPSEDPQKTKDVPPTPSVGDSQKILINIPVEASQSPVKLPKEVLQPPLPVDVPISAEAPPTQPDISAEVHKEVAQAPAVQSPKDASTETSKEVPEKPPADTPQEAVKETPAVSKKDDPKESKKKSEETSQAPEVSKKDDPKESKKKSEETSQAPEVSKKGDPKESKKKSEETSQAPEVLKKESKKKEETSQAPSAKITEPTPPTTPSAPTTPQTTEPPTPDAPKPKSLGIDTSVLDTPPPASEAGACPTPTPPPRKGAGTPKKAGGKKK